MKTPEDIELLLKKARSAEEDEHYACAFELFRQAAERCPERSSIYYRAARNLIELGRLSEAESLLTKLAPQDVPQSKKWVLEFVYGNLRMAQFKAREAEAHFRSAQALHPGSTAPAVFLADALFRQEKFEEAADVLTNALNARGDTDEVYFQLGKVRRAQGDYRTAYACFEQAVAINPSYVEAQLALDDLATWLDPLATPRIATR